MTKKHKVIHDFDFTLIADFFRTFDRQGPGSEAVTRQALALAGPLPADAPIADLGCGTGGQTLTLAAHTAGPITAIDLIPEFVASLKTRIAEAGLAGRITPLHGPMDDLHFAEESLGMIWAEGSISNIGYERGLALWRRYLRPGGIVAVSEATWFTERPSAEIAAFWAANYPEIDTIAHKVEGMQRTGYLPLGHFVLSESCWWNYFDPIRKGLRMFLERHAYSAAAQDLVAHFEEEIALYDRYKAEYGYAFYIGRKQD